MLCMSNTLLPWVLSVLESSYVIDDAGESGRDTMNEYFRYGTEGAAYIYTYVLLEQWPLPLYHYSAISVHLGISAS